MPLIDDEGNLFGAVNVVDALAIVLVLAVVVAGVAAVGTLAGSGDGSSDEAESETATRYATLDLGPQPEYVVDGVGPGDEMVNGDHSLTITDVYASPTDEGAHLVVRAALEGELSSATGEDGDDARFEFAGDRVRLGDELTIDTDDYAVESTVLRVDEDGSELPIRTTEVVLESPVSETTASDIRVGDEYRLGGMTIATVETVRTYPYDGNDSEYRAVIGVELATLERGDRRTFGGQHVAVGSTVPLEMAAYDLEAEVVRRGALEEPGEPTTTTVEIELAEVRPSVADGLEVGMTETIRGTTVATIRAVETQPSTVVLESDDGDIHEREHPQNEDVALTVDLETRETETGLRFHGESLREGETITLDFGTKTVDGDVTRID